MPKTITEQLELNTKEGRKRFYEILVAHKDDLLKYYSVKLPDYDQWEKDYVTKMSLVEKVKEHNKKQAELEDKFTVKDHKFGRLYIRMLQLNGENADKNNQDLFDMATKNDRKGFADLVVKKLFSIDTQKELGNIPGKSMAELAEMYIKDTSKYDVSLIVDDLLINFGEHLEDDVKKKLQEKKGEYNDLVVYINSLHSLSDELFPYIPSPEIENLDYYNHKVVRFNEFDDDLHMNAKINAFAMLAGGPTMKVLVESRDAYEKSVGNKIDDLLAACQASEDKSWTDSKQYDAMKKALKEFKKDWKNPEKADKSKEKLKEAAKAYLVYKADRTMKKNAQGKVAAADGILELIDEIDNHNPFDGKDIKDFIKPSEDKGIYAQRATEVHNKAKEQYGKKKVAVSLKELEKDELVAKQEKEVAAQNNVEQEKKEAVVENIVEQEKKAAVVENNVEQKKAAVVENVIEQEKKAVVIDNIVEQEKKEPEKKEEAQKPAEKLQNAFKDNEEFIALQKKVKNTIKFTSNEFDDASTFSGRQNHFAGYVSLRNLDKRLDKIVDKNYSILDLNEMEKSFEDITAGKTVMSTIKSKPFQKVIQENPFRNMDEKLKPIEELYNDYSAEASKGMTKAENKGKEANKDANKEM